MLPRLLADKARTRSTLSSIFSIDRIWRNEGAAYRHHYVTCNGVIIPTADNQRSEFPCGGLFVLI